MLTGGLVSAESSMMRDEHASLIPQWLRNSFRAAEPLSGYRATVRRVHVAVFGAFLVLACTLFAWVLATDGSPRIAGVPAVAIPIVAFGLIGWLTRMLAQVPHLAEARAARRRGLSVFAVGLFPSTRTYLIVDSFGLLLLRGKRRDVGLIRWRDVEAAALQTSEFGVGLTVSVAGDWYDIPIVLEVGGPAASAWSWAPIGARRALQAAVEQRLHDRVPLHLT